MLVSLDIQKELRGEYWTNRYILDVPSIPDATVPAEEIVAAERDITIADVNFTSYRVSDMVAGTDAYMVVPLGVTGNRTPASQALPLFDVVRVDFSVGLGRPSRKYLRGVLAEGDQTNYGDLETASQATFQTDYADVVAAVTAYVDVDGQPITSGAVFGSVAMRQLRRGSRRRTEPVIPVS